MNTQCTKKIIAYTDTLGKTSHLQLGTAVANAIPVPTCSEGHKPSGDRRPRQVDFIEWTGPVEYLH